MSDDTTSTDTGDATDAKPDASRTFTQDELNGILAADRRKIEDRYADYADIKAKADAHDAAMEAAKSDQDKAVDAARKEGESAATERFNAALTAAEAKAALATVGARNASAAVRLLDLSKVTVTDGKPDDAEITKAVDALKESDPYLFGEAEKPKPKPDPGQGGGGAAKAGSLVGLTGDDLYDRLHPKKPA